MCFVRTWSNGLTYPVPYAASVPSNSAWAWSSCLQCSEFCLGHSGGTKNLYQKKEEWFLSGVRLSSGDSLLLHKFSHCSQEVVVINTFCIFKLQHQWLRCLCAHSLWRLCHCAGGTVLPSGKSCLVINPSFSWQTLSCCFSAGSQSYRKWEQFLSSRITCHIVEGQSQLPVMSFTGDLLRRERGCWHCTVCTMPADSGFIWWDLMSSLKLAKTRALLLQFKVSATVQGWYGILI